MKLAIFDIDGTLQDTLAWWPELCNRARADFAAQHGFRLERLSADDCNAVVGGGFELWATLLPPAHRELASAFAAFVTTREVALLQGGTDRLFPGTREMLGSLREQGVRVALASNCGGRYLEAVLEGQGLSPWVATADCLDGYWGAPTGFITRPVANKSAMLARILREQQEDVEVSPSRAVMVGDRASDARAAQDNALPFVLRTGWHGAGELGEVAAVADSASLERVVSDLLGPRA